MLYDQMEFLDGEIENWFTDDTAERFKSYGWQTIEVDGHNQEKFLHQYRPLKIMKSNRL